MNFWSTSNRYPPVLCRLLARKPNGPPLTANEIAAGSKLTLFDVEIISKQTDWSSVPLPVMRQFLTGCRIDFCSRSDLKRLREYLRSRPTWLYLRRSPLWLSYYEPLLKSYAKSLCPPKP